MIAAYQRQTTSEDGFTLVELMVVVAIISVIAGIIIPNYVHARKQAAVSTTQANLKQIATALELYFADHQDYPHASPASVTPDLFGGPSNGYLNSTPTNDFDRQDYHYTYSSASGAALSYDLLDPASYEPATLANISLGPNATATQRVCGDGATCNHIHYDPRYGIYGAE